MIHGCEMRCTRRALAAVAVSAALAIAGCGDGRNFPKTFPVKGTVLINGQPASDVQVVLNRTSADRLSAPATPQAMTDSKGEFLITSYYAEDGAPEGEYVVTIEWRERSGPMKTEYDGPDRLGGTYAKVEKTKGIPGFTIKVGGQPLELPPFNLTQSAAAKAKADPGKKGVMNFSKDR
jgi:hypothetical protein